MMITDQVAGLRLRHTGPGFPAPFPALRRSRVDTRSATPVLDVTIPVFNEEKDLEECLRRLHGYLQQYFPHPFRITVADNASTDGTLTIAERVAREVPEVAVVHLDEKGRETPCEGSGSRPTHRCSPTWTWTCPRTWRPWRPCWHR